MAFVECNGRIVGYDDSGETALPAMLFAHPLGMSRQVWADVIAKLRGRYRCICWDLPGHGVSAPLDSAVTAHDLAADGQALLAALDIPHCTFVGTSIGGVIGQALLLDAPELLDHVVLTNTGAVIGTAEAWHARAARVRSEGLAQIAPELSQRWFAATYKQNQPAAVAGWTHQLARTDDESYARLCELLAGTDFRGKLAGVEQPVQLIAGADDPATPVTALATLANELGGAPLATIDNIAHVPSVEDAEALTNCLLDACAAGDGATPPGCRSRRGARDAPARARGGGRHLRAVAGRLRPPRGHGHRGQRDLDRALPGRRRAPGPRRLDPARGHGGGGRHSKSAPNSISQGCTSQRL